MRRVEVQRWSDEIGANGTIIGYGHYGRPLLAFGTEQAPAHQWEDAGMIDAVGGLIEAGRVKVYTVSSLDADSWSNASVALEDKARAHERYERWVIDAVLPWIHHDCGGRTDVIAAGSSLGAYHAANLALRHAHRIPLAICMSGVYDLSHLPGGGHRGDAFYFNNPMDYVANTDGGHLDWLRVAAHLLLVCGQGQWEDTTNALESTRAFAGLLASKGIPHELDLWGHDVPHDWPSWRAQLAHHLPRFT